MGLDKIKIQIKYILSQFDNIIFIVNYPLNISFNYHVVYCKSDFWQYYNYLKICWFVKNIEPEEFSFSFNK